MTTVTILTPPSPFPQARDLGCFTYAVMLPSGPDSHPVSFTMRDVRARARQSFLVFLTTAVVVGCHHAPPITEGYPHQQSMRGKSKEQVLACAGTPSQERQEGDLTLLHYYREAPLLEESMVSSKGSRPALHHGCWATVALQGNRVGEVRYRFVPGSVDASDHCEEIFAGCPG